MKSFAMFGLVAAVMIAGVVAVNAQSAKTEAKLPPRTPSPEGAHTYIISPVDGETVPSTFKVQFGLSGMGVAPAGIQVEGTGHHHLAVDYKDKVNMDLPLPASETMRHFGKGQTETVITLPPGEHTLQLILGDFVHRPHDPPVMSKKITVTVTK